MSRGSTEKDYSEKTTHNLKKAVTEMLILSFLDKRDMTIHQILDILDTQSGSACKIQYPYGVIYRMTDRNFIEISGKAVSDERRRLYHHITDEGREYLKKVRKEYDEFRTGFDKVLEYVDTIEEMTEEEKKAIKM